MASKQNRYAPEFRRKIVELVRAGLKPRELSREFGSTPWSIALWVKQVARDAGRGDGGLTSEERGRQQLQRREVPGRPQGDDDQLGELSRRAVRRRQRHGDSQGRMNLERQCDDMPYRPIKLNFSSIGAPWI